MNWDLLLEIAGTIIGLIYLYYEYKAHRLLWVMGIIMPAVSVAVYYNAGLYADMGINIYYIIAGVYGFVVWSYKNKRRRTVELPISNTPRNYYIPILIITLALWGAIYLLLTHCTDSNVPTWDALTTAISVAAMWMLARKYIEQWWLWIVVDIISVGLYIYKGIYLYAALYALYAIVAVMGYKNWIKLMNNERD